MPPYDGNDPNAAGRIAVNRYRPRGPLRGDASLAQAAQRHARDMAQMRDMAHRGSDGSNFAQRVFQARFSGHPRGETIGYGRTTVEATVTDWMSSNITVGGLTHRDILTDARATHIGFGLAYTADGIPFWCAVTGQRS